MAAVTYYIAAGTRTPHPRHYPNLAALAGVKLPEKFAAALAPPLSTRCPVASEQGPERL